jgi:hypothetical protein
MVFAGAYLFRRPETRAGALLQELQRTGPEICGTALPLLVGGGRMRKGRSASGRRWMGWDRDVKEAEEVATINEVVVRLLLPLPHGCGPDFGAAGGARRWRLARAEWAGKRAEGVAAWAREVNADGGAGAGAGRGGELMAGRFF